MVPKPIQAKTLVKEANSSRGIAWRGTIRDWPRPSASAARITPASTPARPRANSGGHCSSNSFIKGQFSAQPKAVTTRQRKPIERSRREESMRDRLAAASGVLYCELCGWMRTAFAVMAGLVPAIHVLAGVAKDVAARVKPGHDERKRSGQPVWPTR